MLSTIYFNNQSKIKTDKIKNIIAKRMLASKFKSG